MYHCVTETDYCPHRTSEYPRLWLWEVEGREGKLPDHSDFQTCKGVKYIGRKPRAFLYDSDRTLLYPTLTQRAYSWVTIWHKKVKQQNADIFPFQTPTWAAWLLPEETKRHPDHLPRRLPPLPAELWSSSSSFLHQGQTEFPQVLQPFPAGQLQNKWVSVQKKVLIKIWSKQKKCLKLTNIFFASNFISFTCCFTS